MLIGDVPAEELRRRALVLSTSINFGDMDIDDSAEKGIELAEVVGELILRARKETEEASDDALATALKPKVLEDLQNRFGYHPATDSTAISFNEIRMRCLDLAVAVTKLCPPGREHSLALTNLEQVMYWGNAGIARATPLASDPRRARI